MKKSLYLLASVAMVASVFTVSAEDRESIEDAWITQSSVRTRICLNGLWSVGPEKDSITAFGKLPGVWKVSSNAFITRGQDWRTSGGKKLEQEDFITTEAWYSRTFKIPPEAKDKRVAVVFTMVNSAAEVYLDGQLAGKVAFPNGEVDVTNLVRPGEKQAMMLHVTAYPRNATTLDYSAPDRAHVRESTVRLRGITGDVFLDLTPKGTLLARPAYAADTEKSEIEFSAEASGRLPAGCKLVATVEGCGEKTRRFSSQAVSVGLDGRVRFTAEWPDAKRWDLHTPGNIYSCRLSLVGPDGGMIDETVPFTLGFRDFKCRGRDFVLNGSTVHLRVLHNTTMNTGAHLSSKKSALEFCRRLKADGYNTLIVGNYGFGPGSVSYPEGLLSACDETGVMVSYSLPHARDYNEQVEDPKVQAAYLEATRGVIEIARNHPSVVLYAMNHNYAGYGGDMNPERMDGKYELSETCTNSCMTRRRKAAICESLVRKVDESRPIYHHESGNMGDLHTTNIYLNWAPVQERSDWLEHWAAEGVKPVFFVEWGLPHIGSWSSYRGPEFIWRCSGYQSCWAEEYAAAFFGPDAYEASKNSRNVLKAEDECWETGAEFSWGTFVNLLRYWDAKYYDLQALYANDNWRSLRAAGASAMLPWDQDTFWIRRGDWTSKENPDALVGLKNPGIVPDFFASDGQYWTDYDTTPGVFVRSPTGEALDRWNQPDCAFIGGCDAATDKRHNVRAGESVRKSLMILNDRRTVQNVGWSWKLLDASGTEIASGAGSSEVQPGGRADVQVDISIPKASGFATMVAEFVFEGGAKSEDRFRFDVVPEAKTPAPKPFRLVDKVGETAKLLDRLDIADDEAARDAIIVGRGSLTRDLFQEQIVPLAREGAHVLVFEQDKQTLESIGFRVQEYGLRKVFVRSRDAAVSGTASETWANWAGSSTLVPQYLTDVERDEVDYPRTEWAGFVNTRVWRSGNRGAVATVLPEKPSCGDWRALLDGGFALQYAPLLEWRLGAGSIVFCQMDVTARTADDPAADDLVRCLIARLSSVKTGRGAVPFALGPTAFVELQRYGVPCERPRSQTYVVTSGAEKPEGFDQRIANGATVLLLGLTKEELAKWCPMPLQVESRKGVCYERIAKPGELLDGLSDADWAWHGLMAFDGFTDHAEGGSGSFRVLEHGKGRIVIWQTPPWKIDTVTRPQLRISVRGAYRMLERLFGNLGIRSELSSIRYADDPIAGDDPYRYYRW